MSPEENKAIVRRYIEEWANGGDPKVVEELVADDWVSHGTQSATATPSGGDATLQNRAEQGARATLTLPQA